MSERRGEMPGDFSPTRRATPGASKDQIAGVATGPLTAKGFTELSVPFDNVSDIAKIKKRCIGVVLRRIERRRHEITAEIAVYERERVELEIELRALTERATLAYFVANWNLE